MFNEDTYNKKQHDLHAESDGSVLYPTASALNQYTKTNNYWEERSEWVVDA